MFARVGRAVTRRPWLVIVGWLLAAATIMALSPKISEITTSDQASFLPASAESTRAARLAAEAFPAATGASVTWATAVIVVDRSDAGAFTSGDLATIEALAQNLNATKPPAVLGVQVDQLSPDGSVALLGVRFTEAPEEPALAHAVDTLRRHSADALANTTLTAGMTGQAAIVVDNGRAFGDAEQIVTVATLILILGLLLVVFRSPVAAALPLLTVGLVFGVTTALVAAAGSALGWRVGQELPTMLTVVLFGIGTDYVLFLLFRYRERLRAGETPRRAIGTAVERVGQAILSAGLAVIAAFGALVLAALGFFTTLGPALAIGVLVMVLAALTLVPAVVTVLGSWLFWPSAGTRRPARHGGFATLGRLVARRPASVVLAGVALLGGLAAGAVRFAPDYDPIAQLPPDTESARAFQDLKRGFPAGALEPTAVYLTGDEPVSESVAGAFVQRLADVDGVAAVQAPRVAADGRSLAVPLVLAAEPFSAQAMDLVAGPIRDTARAAAPAGSTVLVGGQSMAFADVRHTTDRDFALIFPAAGILFVLILATLLRAVLPPLYLVAMVVLGFAATLGATTLVFQVGLGNAGLTFSIPIILYLFVTAIGTDYNILVTARLREEARDGRAPREAAALALAHAGPSVTAAAVILAGTFGSLLVTGVPFFVQVGFAVTLGILLVAFVVSLLLVPAAFALVGRAAWWPGRGRPTTIAPREPLRGVPVSHKILDRTPP